MGLFKTERSICQYEQWVCKHCVHHQQSNRAWCPVMEVHGLFAAVPQVNPNVQNILDQIIPHLGWNNEFCKLFVPIGGAAAKQVREWNKEEESLSAAQ